MLAAQNGLKADQVVSIDFLKNGSTKVSAILGQHNRQPKLSLCKSWLKSPYTIFFYDDFRDSWIRFSKIALYQEIQFDNKLPLSVSDCSWAAGESAGANWGL